MLRSFIPVAITTAFALGGCAERRVDLPQGSEAYASFPAPSGNTQRTAYRIGPLDVLNVTVFQEPDLTVPQAQVDASGNMLFPLIGDVRAQGKTTRELSREIALRLGAKYIVNPQVTVAVTSSVSQRVTVEGSVTEPGVYEITGSSTLLEALARAKSPTRTASTSQVVVFRNIEGQRTGAVFNIDEIRAGRAQDPEILGGDVIVVGFSSVKGAFRDVLAAAPLLNIFIRY
jgi:polysaccharide export outer membrane protein